jgi:hypothetical protein
LIEDTFETLPKIKEENLIKKPRPLRTLSKYPLILKALTKYLGKCLQNNWSLIEIQNMNLILLIIPLLPLPHRCLPHILKLIDFLHLSRDPSPLLRYLILLQPLKSYNRKMISCCNNWKRGRLWMRIFNMTMQYSKKR